MRFLICAIVAMTLAGCLGFRVYSFDDDMHLSPLGPADSEGYQLYDAYITDEADAKPGDPEREARRRKWVHRAMTERDYTEYGILDARIVPLHRGVVAKLCEYHYTIKIKVSE